MRDKAGSVLYALGWTHHTIGSQIIRTSAIIQLLLGNIGIAGGGINALRGQPNVQGSTDGCLLFHLIPGYLKVPRSSQQTLEAYLKDVHSQDGRATVCQLVAKHSQVHGEPAQDVLRRQGDKGKRLRLRLAAQGG